ncbi:MAG: hypothetical protein OCC49_19260 [Fibrobacterales bacterium]
MKKEKTYTSTRNACKLCAPLGASMVYKGVRGCVPLIHGSQGCATYIRRYMISHYKEPVDIASSNFSEDSTIFGGDVHMEQALDNIVHAYNPEVVGIASTCLSETIGDDISMFLHSYNLEREAKKLPVIVSASTPSYAGTHMDGFHAAVKALIKQCAVKGDALDTITMLPGFVSCEDLRHLKEIFAAFHMPLTLLPDYSQTLDDGTWGEFKKIADGGTPYEQIKNVGSSKCTIEFGTVFNKSTQKTVTTAGEDIHNSFGVPNHQLVHPIGVKASDAFFNLMEDLSGVALPEQFEMERARLIDSYMDGHKYCYGKRVLVYGEEDFVIALCSFLKEIGMTPVMVATGGASGLFNKTISDYVDDDCIIRSDADFEEMAEIIDADDVDLLIGHSKGYYISRKIKKPLVRVGFPIHDRIGGQRILHLGYRGTQQLFDSIINVLIEYKQEHSPVGYKYI